MITATIDQKALARADARLAKYQGKPLALRAKKAYLEGARLMVGPMRRAAPRGPTGNLRASIKARTPRLRPGEMAAASVGPRGKKGAHRYLVVSGTTAHSLAGKRPGKGRFAVFPDGEVRRDVMHPGSRAQPFVAEVRDRMGAEVASFIAGRVLDIGGLTTSF